MAKWDIKHACGCTVTHNIGGKVNDRDRIAERKARENCWDCEKVARAEQAQAANQSAGLPALEGSEKQVAWAEQIRATAASHHRQALKAAEPESALAVLGAALSNPSAKFWIDNRQLVRNHYTETVRAWSRAA